MKLLSSAIALALLLVLLASCGDGVDTAAASPAEFADVVPSTDAMEHNLKCGCAIESVGRCGNFIEVDGDFVALEAPLELGEMAFCGKDDMHARCDGEVTDGVFVATTFEYVD